MKELITAFKELQEATADHDGEFERYEELYNSGGTWATWGKNSGWGLREVTDLRDATDKFEAALNNVIDKRIQTAIANKT